MKSEEKNFIMKVIDTIKFYSEIKKIKRPDINAKLVVREDCTDILNKFSFDIPRNTKIIETVENGKKRRICKECKSDLTITIQYIHICYCPY